MPRGRAKPRQLALPIALGRRSARPDGRLRRQVAWGTTALLLIVLLAGIAFLEATALRAPRDEETFEGLRAAADPGRGNGISLSVPGGKLSRWRGISLLELNGSSRGVGLAHGALLAAETSVLSDSTSDLLGVRRAGIAGLVTQLRRRWWLRGLAKDLPASSLVELASLSRSATHVVPTESLFGKLVLFQAMPEALSELVPEAFSGTFAFAAWGRQTASKALLVGRTFAIRGGAQLAHQKLISVVRPLDGRPYLTLGWSGAVGGVTGVNDSRIFVAVTPAQGDETIAAGVPATIIAKQVLQGASSIARGITIVRQLAPISPFSLLLADGKVPAAVVVEVSRRGVAVRRPGRGRSSEFVVATDHLRHKRHAGDATNERFRRYTSSGARYRILEARLDQSAGKLDPERALALLRDRETLEGEHLPLGHPGAVDNGHAVQAVILDMGRFALWVARGPGLQGPFMSFDLVSLFSSKSPRKSSLDDLPEDPVCNTPEFERFLWGKKEMERAERYRKNLTDSAITFAARAVSIWGDVPQTHLLLADLLWASGQVDRSRRHYREFLARHPANRDAVARATSRGRAE